MIFIRGQWQVAEQQSKATFSINNKKRVNTDADQSTCLLHNRNPLTIGILAFIIEDSNLNYKKEI